MSDQDKRAISICEAMENIPRATSPRTPLVWAYEVKAQRDELLAALKEMIAAMDNSMNLADDIAAMIRFGEAKKECREVIKKVEKTL